MTTVEWQRTARAGTKVRSGSLVGWAWIFLALAAGCAAEPVPPAPWDAGASGDAASDAADTTAVQSDAAAALDGGSDADATDGSDGSARAAGCFDGACNDGNPCTTDSCKDAVCLHEPVTTTCDDGNACTADDSCVDGSCKGAAVGCPDAGPCSLAVCEVQKGCQLYPLDGAACDDDNACTPAAYCQAGACVATVDAATACDDGNACTADVCALALGCSHTAVDADCDDGSACTNADACAAGECRGSPKDCGDGDPCTQDACDPGLGCVWPAKPGATCDDGNACTTGDLCGTDGCEAGAPVVCDDGVACTTDACELASGCTATVNDAACDDGVGCTLDVCSPQTGCSHLPDHDGCADANPCTNDACDLAADCTYVANQLPCADGDACTLADTCTQTACVGTSRDCVDGNPCTQDACDSASGCVFLANTATCTDGNVCTTLDACAGGGCVAGPPLVCNDGNPCTADGCSPTLGCINSLLSIGCDDGNACTTVDLCAASGCIGTEVAFCDDGKVCTEDSCLPTQGCLHIMTIDPPCSDGDACTAADHCDGGECVSTVATVCDDDNPCTANLCAADSGCQFPDQYGSCSDSNPCTVGDACVGGSCFAGTKKNCDDGNPCTIDYCDSGITPPASNCRNIVMPGVECDDNNNCTDSSFCVGSTCTGSGTDCSDGNACTTDSCGTGGCEHAPLICNDNNVCTTDSCSAATGCKFTINNAVTCDDNNPCTVNTKCSAQGSCQGLLTECNDGNPCTVDSCDTASGCVYTGVSGPSCSDGNHCSTGDACVLGTCTGQGTLSCNDGNACTVDACFPAMGCANAPAAEWTPCGSETSHMACSGGGVCQSFALSRQMTVVPGGTFAMGCNPSVDLECEDDELPQRVVQLPAYWLDLFEVTVARYKQCVTAGACTAPTSGTYLDADGGSLPVTHVAHAEAKAFCAWQGKRLPTEAEWEKAARGGCDIHGPGEPQCKSATWKFPWGNDAVSCSNAIFTGPLGTGCGAGTVWEVGSSAGSGPYLHMNLAGNLAEWVDDLYSATWYSDNSSWTNPKGPTSNSNGYRGLRGGSWLSFGRDVRASNRSSAAPDSRNFYIGFRCARTW